MRATGHGLGGPAGSSRFVGMTGAAEILRVRAKREVRMPNQATMDAIASFPTIRVFLAEDDAAMRQMIASALRRDGHFVLEARDGPGLLLEIGHAYWGDLPDSTPTVVISDLRMPGRDGLSILRGLRQHVWCPPFILITGFGDRSIHDEAARLGAHAVFDKPFDLDQLRAAVRRLGANETGPPPNSEHPRDGAGSTPQGR
jgi:two-component system, response regulator, stage 0 sporulation protein F